MQQRCGLTRHSGRRQPLPSARASAVLSSHPSRQSPPPVGSKRRRAGATVALPAGYSSLFQAPASPCRRLPAAPLVLPDTPPAGGTQAGGPPKSLPPAPQVGPANNAGAAILTREVGSGDLRAAVAASHALSETRGPVDIDDTRKRAPRAAVVRPAFSEGVVAAAESTEAVSAAHPAAGGSMRAVSEPHGARLGANASPQAQPRGGAQHGTLVNEGLSAAEACPAPGDGDAPSSEVAALLAEPPTSLRPRIQRRPWQKGSRRRCAVPLSNGMPGGCCALRRLAIEARAAARPRWARYLFIRKQLYYG